VDLAEAETAEVCSEAAFLEIVAMGELAPSRFKFDVPEGLTSPVVADLGLTGWVRAGRVEGFRALAVHGRPFWGLRPGANGLKSCGRNWLLRETSTIPRLACSGESTAAYSVCQV